MSFINIKTNIFPRFGMPVYNYSNKSKYIGNIFYQMEIMF